MKCSPIRSHHHHHRKGDEDLNPAAIGRPSSSTSFNTFKFNSTTPNAPSTITHHHHHHHPPHHHHAIKVLSANTPTVTLPRLTTIVKSESLLQSIAHLPRHHLGSQLYAPKLSLPPCTTTPLDSEHPYECTPNPLPYFDGRENCTFTVRIPRYHLSATARRAVCEARNVWGTDVYTDDSDPLAAAIHAGWLRGAWPSEVDEAMLDLSPDLRTTTTNGTPTTQPPTTMTAPPTDGPMDAPPNADCHLTLLILPTLALYAPSVRFGLASRRWGGNHDGASFKIERIEWVDEGATGRNEDRGAQARRVRLARLASPRLTAGVGVKAVGGVVARTNRRQGRMPRPVPGVGSVMV